MTRQVLISLRDSSGDGNLGSDRRRRRYSEKGGLLRRDPLQGGHYQELEWGYLETGGGAGLLGRAMSEQRSPRAASAEGARSEEARGLC